MEILWCLYTKKYQQIYMYHLGKIINSTKATLSIIVKKNATKSGRLK